MSTPQSLDNVSVTTAESGRESQQGAAAAYAYGPWEVPVVKQAEGKCSLLLSYLTVLTLDRITQALLYSWF